MSKFQVGDKVVHREIKRSEGEVVNIQADGRLVLCSGGALVHDCRPENFELADPHVPDVDGTPIRVGQLVEACGESTTPFIGARRVKEVADIPGSPPSASLPGTGWWSSRDLRVLTADDLLVPPEPDTRDATLRVTFADAPADLDVDGTAYDVEGALEHFGFVDFTVEVVDDGGHDDG